MNVGEFMKLDPQELKAIKNKHSAHFRGVKEYSEMFPYLTNQEAMELTQQLQEIPKGHRSRGRVVGYYSNINEQRKLTEIRGC